MTVGDFDLHVLGNIALRTNVIQKKNLFQISTLLYRIPSPTTSYSSWHPTWWTNAKWATYQQHWTSQVVVNRSRSLQMIPLLAQSSITHHRPTTCSSTRSRSRSTKACHWDNNRKSVLPICRWVVAHGATGIQDEAKVLNKIIHACCCTNIRYEYNHEYNKPLIYMYMLSAKILPTLNICSVLSTCTWSVLKMYTNVSRISPASSQFRVSFCAFRVFRTSSWQNWAQRSIHGNSL